jgi:cellulose synthase operon protein C
MIKNVLRHVGLPASAVLLQFVLALSLIGASGPAAADGAKVDETALRYYAAHDDTTRLEAEVRRLKALYPDWVEPGDLAGATEDREKPLWAIFATGDMVALERAIAAARVADPSFVPSADLLAKMERQKARAELIAAADAGDTVRVRAIAEVHADLFGPTDPDVAWRVAAAWAPTDPAHAKDLYTRLLREIADAPLRLATVQKAVLSLGSAAGHDLMAEEKTPGEFDSLRPDFARAAVAAALSAGTGTDPDPVDLRAFEKVAEAGPKPDDAAMLGWWYRARHDADAALRHFQTAATLAGPAMDPKIAEGLALSLADLGRRTDAAQVAHDNRDRSDTLAKLYVGFGASAFEGTPRPDVAPSVIDDYAATVNRLSDGTGAEILGWYFLDRKTPTQARDWFARGLSWSPSEALANGAVYASLAAKDTAGAKASVERWKGEYPKLASIKLGGAAPVKTGKDAMVVAFEAKNFSGCLSEADARPRLAPGLSLIKGWCLMQLKRPAEALLAFETAMTGGGKVREDAAYGKSLAAIATGDTRGAVATAISGISEPSRRAEIATAALADEAKVRFDAEDWRGALDALQRRAAITRETSDLALLRGWCLWHLGQTAAARELFVRLDNLLSTADTRRAVATANGRP